MNRRRLLSDVSAATAIEFALVGPLLLFLLIAIIEGARLLFITAVLQHAAAEASRCLGLADAPCHDPSVLVRDVSKSLSHLGSTVDAESLAVDVVGRACGQAVRVEIQPRSWLLPSVSDKRWLAIESC